MCFVMCGLWPTGRIVCFPESFMPVKSGYRIRQINPSMDFATNSIRVSVDISPSDLEGINLKDIIDKRSQIYKQLCAASLRKGIMCCPEDDIEFSLEKINDIPNTEDKMYIFELKYKDNLCKNLACTVECEQDGNAKITILGLIQAIKGPIDCPGLVVTVENHGPTLMEYFNQPFNFEFKTCLRKIMNILGPKCPIRIIRQSREIIKMHMNVLKLKHDPYSLDVYDLTLESIIDGLSSNTQMLNNLRAAIYNIWPPDYDKPHEPKVKSLPPKPKPASRAQQSSGSSSSSTSPAPVPEQLTQEYKSEYRIEGDTIEVAGLKMMLKMQFDCKGQIMDTITGADLRDLVDYKNSIPLLFCPCNIIRMALYRRDQANGTWALHGNYVFRTEAFVKTEEINVYAIILAGFEWGNREIEPKHPNKQSKVNSFPQHYNDIIPFYATPEEMTLMQ